MTQTVASAQNPNQSYITDAEGYVLEVDRYDANGTMAGREHDLVMGGEPETIPSASNSARNQPKTLVKFAR